MTKALMTSLALAIGALAVMSEGRAASAIEEYALSERCGKRVEEFWSREHKGKPQPADQILYYENHYSRKLNRCFYVEIIKNFDKKSGEWLAIYTLFDMNDHKEVASYAERQQGAVTNIGTLSCSVNGTKCSNKEEWDQLAKPYLEE